jgi:hypothetical protein
MKKGPRNIPDFSPKAKPKPGVPADKQAPKKGAPQTAARNVKPPATSSKSGRRGS